MPKKKAPSLPLYRNIAVSFSALALLLVALILYFSLARATITVLPRVQSFPLTTSFALDKTNSVVLARDITKEGTFDTSIAREEDAKASGTITITNTTNNPQTLVATTRFLSSEKILFRLKETVVAPARGKVTGTIVADVPGAGGEVAPTRWIIPGLRPELQTKIYGESEVAPTGGRRAIRALTADDISRARDGLRKQVEEEVRAEVAGTSPERQFVILTQKAVSSTVSEKLGARVEKFRVAVTEHVEAVAVPERTLHGWLSERMKTTLPDDQRLLPFALDSVTASVSALDATAGTARVLVQGEGRAVLRSTSPVFDRTRFVGRTPEEVRSLLRSHGGIADVKVKLSPFFVKRLPRLPDHITIQIREP
jgi:hypothetical protein